MNNDFKKTIRELREKHFPGRSIRSLKDELEDPLGQHFYTYISKLEAGLLPSVDFLKKVSNAYNLTQVEYQALFESYFHQKMQNDVARSGMEIAKPVLFRKLKKSKE